MSVPFTSGWRTWRPLKSLWTTAQPVPSSLFAGNNGAGSLGSRLLWTAMDWESDLSFLH